MRKLITITLILALLIPAAALADDQDPIIGCWYLYYDAYIYPEFASTYGNVESEVSIYYFLPNGSIMLLDNPIKGESSTPTYSGCGRWQKTDNGYTYSLVGLGEGDARITDNGVELQLPGSTVYMVMRSLIPFNPYADYIR